MKATQLKLFDLPEKKAAELKTCKDCKHLDPWKYNTKTFFYCKLIKSKRTVNGLKKVDCKDQACYLFEPIK